MSFVSKEMQDGLQESLQHQLQEVENRRNDLMPEFQKAQKRTQKIQSLQDKRRNLQKESWAANKKKCGKSEKKLSGRKSASLSWRTKSTKTEWQMWRWMRSSKGCRLEKKQEAVTHRKRLIAVWRRWWNRFSLWERIKQGLRPVLC